MKRVKGMTGKIQIKQEVKWNIPSNKNQSKENKDSVVEGKFVDGEGDR